MGRQASKHNCMEPAAVHTGSTSAMGSLHAGGHVALGSEEATEIVVPGKDHTDGLPTLGRRAQKLPAIDHAIAEPSEALPAGRLSDAELKELWELLFGLAPDEDDVLRWMQSAFVFVGNHGTAGDGESLPCPWGLRQDVGGPCGVLASVQAFIVRELLWGTESGAFPRTPSATSTASTEFGTDVDSDSGASASMLSTPRTSTPARVEETGHHGRSSAKGSCEQHLANRFAQAGEGALLACALARMLHTAATVSTYIWAEVHSRTDVTTHHFKSAHSLQQWLASKDGIGVLPCPVLSFVCSIMLTRGLNVVRTDMDDASVPLVGLFGHCSQDLTNLCLTGCATTNVFDGDMTFEEGGDALKLRGISRRPEIGFFSALEPLRFCEVGKLFKQPRYPLWVVGSATHYTLLFSGECSASHSRAAVLPQDAAADAEALCPCCGGNISEGSESAASLRLLYFNGRDFGAEKPTLVPVELQVPCARPVGEQTPLGTLLSSDQDDRIFAEVLRCRWPEAKVTYPGFGNSPNKARGPPRLS
mmetsp:Transcript_14638/g.28827  ORF Transcript_14638/g.28827 Transcript_14638/m.28827 type:complete len:532 (-) Transcript_14638:83-1678(-)